MRGAGEVSFDEAGCACMWALDGKTAGEAPRQR